MNKKLLGVLGVAALLLAGNFAWQEVKEIKSVDAATTDEWWLVGSMNGWSNTDGYKFTYNSTTKNFELKVNLTKNDTFKIRLGTAWTKQAHWRNGQANGGTNDSDFTTYITGENSTDYGEVNFKVKTTNTYLFSLVEGASTYGDVEWGLSIDLVTTINYELTYYTKAGSKIETVEVPEGSIFNPLFKEEEGYRLEGWYTDKTLKNKFVKGSKVTSSLSLYPKYVEASDYRIYFKDASNVLGDKVNVYMWCDSFDGHDNAWPGAAMSVDAKGRYYVDIDASKTFDKIIFNDGTAQTEDLSLTNAINGDTYILSLTDKVQTVVLDKTSVTNLFAEYYGTGTYTKKSVLNVNSSLMQEVKTYFHASADTRYRKTEYTPSGLTMTTSENGETYSDKKSIYTNGDNCVVHSGEVGGNYTYSTDKVKTVEDWFVTLYDFKESTLTGWTEEDGVYTYNLVATTANAEDEMTRMAREFVAPMWLAPNASNYNYVTFEKLTVQEVGNELVMKLYVKSDNGGKLLDGSNLVFSQVTISK